MGDDVRGSEHEHNAVQTYLGNVSNERAELFTNIKVALHHFDEVTEGPASNHVVEWEYKYTKN